MKTSNSSFDKKFKKRTNRFSQYIKRLIEHSGAKGFKTISSYLNKQKIFTINGKQWTPKAVKEVMEN